MYQCSGCDKFFSHKGTFFAHRVGDHQLRTRHCMSTDEMLAAGFTSTEITGGKNKGKTVWRSAAPVDGRPEAWDSKEEEDAEELSDSE
jgi:hypothetical protein